MTELHLGTNIFEAAQDERVQKVFLKLGLKCLDCPAMEVESLRQAAIYHNIDPQVLLDEIRAATATQQNADQASK